MTFAIIIILLKNEKITLFVIKDENWFIVSGNWEGCVRYQEYNKMATISLLGAQRVLGSSQRWRRLAKTVCRCTSGELSCYS